MASEPHRIDIHHHVAPPRYIAELKSLLQPPTINWTPEKSLADMDEAGVATSILSITTPGVVCEANATATPARSIHSTVFAGEYPTQLGLIAPSSDDFLIHPGDAK